MYKLTHRLAVLAVLALTVGCGIVVHTTFDPAASFGQLRTYAWDENTQPPAVTTSGIDPVVLDTAVRTAVNEELSAKGYAEVAESPDFIVTYRILFDSPDYPYGTLVLDIIDPRSGRVGWTGSAENVVDPGDPTACDRNMRDGLAKMLKRFPPQ